MHKKKRIQTTIVKAAYAEYQKSYDEASENAFNNIQWLGAATDPDPKSAVGFPMGTSFQVVILHEIIEQPMSELMREISDGSTINFIWQVKGYLVNTVRDRIVHPSQYTNRQANTVAIMTEAALYGVNTEAERGRCKVEGTMYVGRVLCAPEDMNVIFAAIADMKSRATMHLDGLADNVSGDLPEKSHQAPFLILDEMSEFKEEQLEAIEKLKPAPKPWTPVAF